MSFLTSRSAVLANQDCPRYRYLGYHFGGLGIAKRKLAVPLATGIYTHEFLGNLLFGKSEDESAGLAVDAFRKGLVDRELDLEAGDFQAWSALEQISLVEGLGRCYARIGLPRLAGYKVLEVEREDSNELCSGITWQSRNDALLEDPDGELVVQSFKTKGTDRPEDVQAAYLEAQHDMQGLSEAWAVEQRLGRKVLGIRMEWLLKGKRMFDEALGRYVQYSPLIRAWRTEGVVPEYAWRWAWKDEEGRKKQLSWQRWKPFWVWEAMGVKEWLDMLGSGQVQPELGNPLEQQVVTMPLIYRTDEQVARWTRQVRSEEIDVMCDLDCLALDGDPDTCFPQHTRRCHDKFTFGRNGCPFIPICHESPQIAADPVGSGLYVVREPHHPVEEGD